MPQPNSTRNDEYTLKIVFSGIVPLVREPLINGAERLWVLVSNLKAPSTLPDLPGHLIPKHHDCKDDKSAGSHEDHSGTQECHSHINRLLVPSGHLKSVGKHRTIQRGAEVCRETGTFDFVELQNEHLTLEHQANWDPLNPWEGYIHPPIPCVLGTTTKYGKCNATGTIKEQEADIGWLLDIDKILKASTKPMMTPPKLKKQLFDDSYTPNNPKNVPLLSARFVFDRGSLTTRTLDKDSAGKYRIYRVRNFDGKPHILRQTVATQVQITLTARGPIVFQSRALDDHKTQLDPIVIENVGKKSELTVFIENQPKDLDCTKSDLGGHHFYLNHHLLDHPERLRGLRVPEHLGIGPALNAQCSPPLYSKP